METVTTTIIRKCSMNKLMYSAQNTTGSFTVCLFTATLKGQASSFPDNVQKYGSLAFFKVSSQHLPTNMLDKTSFDIEGHWEKDKYSNGDGHIFIAEKATESLPETDAEITKFLIKSCKGVGKTMATAVVQKFGKDTLDISAHTCKKLLEVPKMTEKLMGEINYACLAALTRADVQELLKNAGVEVSVVDKIVEYYGDSAPQILSSEPYKLVSLLGFSLADRIAMSMGEDPCSGRRLHAATLEAQKKACTKTGVMCAEQGAVVAQLQNLVPDVTDESVLVQAIEATTQVYDVVRQGKYLYSKADFITERDMAGKIAELASEKPNKEKEIERAFLEWQKENAMILSPKQAEAVRNLKYRISIVTGGPGTGKTTCLRAIMDVYRKVWPSEQILLMAPTGLAAKRMAESTGMNSATIHKACGLVPANNSSGFTSQGECRICGFVGIDEMSMVGEHLFAFAIDAVLNSPSTRIVLLGDTDQLAPVSRGDVLRDLIQCGVVKTARLDVNYRQGSTSTITDASIKIRENRAYTGSIRNLKFDDEFDFVSVTDLDQKTEADKIMEKVIDEYTTAAATYGVKGTIVLTPTHFDNGTPAGFLSKNRVNAAIQAKINPKVDGKPFVEVNRQAFMVGDRIIQRRNTAQVINGDLGTIISIEKEDGNISVEIMFDSKDEVITYDNIDMKNIELAYAITVHSSQGCEFPCCIFPVSNSYGPMLTKPLYYTGITRAKKKLIMIGDEEAFKKAVRTCRTQGRKSLLGPRIIKKLAAI